MTPTENTSDSNDRLDDDIGRLIRYAGARDSAGAERMAKARGRVLVHWQGVVAGHGHRRRRHRVRRFGLAASVFLAVATITLGWLQFGAPPVLGLITVNRVIGEVRVNGERIEVGDRLIENDILETSLDSRIALALEDGQSVRLDDNSRVRVMTAGRFELASGALYVDSGLDDLASPVRIETEFGVATDIGTQFLVSVKHAGLQIGVREGLVQLQQSGGKLLDVDSGELLQVSSAGLESVSPIRGNDPLWQWVSAISTNFELEGATLEQYLNWYARESGLVLQWENERSRENARRIRLSGSIVGLDLEEGLQSVLRIAPFDYVVHASSLRITVD